MYYCVYNLRNNLDAKDVLSPDLVKVDKPALLEQPTLASRVSLFLLDHFSTNECEIADFCL